MPSGYTAGILDGKIKTFPQFAQQCMRAFGACIHMKEDDFDAKYQPRVPSDYYSKELKNKKKELKKIESCSDKELIAMEEKTLNEGIENYTKIIEEGIENRKLLDAMLNKIMAWNPPTTEHDNFKKFMIEQITETIRIDGDTSYYDKELERLNSKLKNINAKETRKELIKELKHSIEYNTKHLNDEIENCKTSNKWVEDLIKSLK